MTPSRPLPPVRVAVADWEAWRATARALLAAGTAPDRVLWDAAEAAAPQPALQLFADTAPAELAGGRAEPAVAATRVPRRFVELGEAVACHRDPARWPLLYRVRWRIAHGERQLVEIDVDPDVRQLLRMERAVRRASHKMQAFLRFRATGGDADPFVAWFEPEHRVTERVAPFFVRRFAAMRWSILTPDRCAHWDGQSLRYTPGLTSSAGPAHDALETLWRTYYASIFNPARLNPRAMRSEMPKAYWKNLPEAQLIPGLQQEAADRARRMVRRASTPESEPALRRPARRPRGR